MSLWTRVEKGCEDEVLEDEAGGTPRKGDKMGTDPGEKACRRVPSCSPP